MTSAGTGGRTRVPTYHAVQSRAVFYQYMFIAVAVIACGLLVLLVVTYQLIRTEPRVYHLIMMAVSIAVIVIGVDIGHHNWPKGSLDSVVVDGRSVRLMENGKVRKEFFFAEGVRIGASFNTAYHVPQFKPLHGVEFERSGDVIEVSPKEGFLLDDVARLWPIVLVLTKAHDLRPTPYLVNLMEREAKKGDYWKGIRGELVGKEPKPSTGRDKADGP